MRLPITIIPEEIITQYYNILLLVHNDHRYMEIHKGMYGLPQSNMLTNKLLQKHITHYGYMHLVKHAPRL
jgi:hypothetical protein